MKRSRRHEDGKKQNQTPGWILTHHTGKKVASHVHSDHTQLGNR